MCALFKEQDDAMPRSCALGSEAIGDDVRPVLQFGVGNANVSITDRKAGSMSLDLRDEPPV